MPAPPPSSWSAHITARVSARVGACRRSTTTPAWCLRHESYFAPSASECHTAGDLFDVAGTAAGAVFEWLTAALPSAVVRPRWQPRDGAERDA
jgi:hypothetical protein